MIIPPSVAAGLEPKARTCFPSEMEARTRSPAAHGDRPPGGRTVSRARWVAAVLVLATLGAGLAWTRLEAGTSPTLGVQTHLLWSGVSRDEVERQLTAAEASGARMVRADLGWSSLEQHAKGRYEAWYLAKVDFLVARAKAHHVDLLLTVTGTPCWASSAPAPLKRGCPSSGETGDAVAAYAPSNPRDYADALAFLVARYGDRVRAWEVWNEPNSTAFWRAEDPAARYAELVRSAYPAAKRADERTTIVVGALSEADYRFAESLYADGISGYLDALSIHPYSGDRSPLDPQPEQYLRDSFVRGVPAIRAVMTRHGDDSPLWLTEFGWSTTTSRGGESWENGVSEEAQARYLAEAYAQMRRWDYVPVGITYELQDIADDPRDRLSNYGLLRDDSSPKPALRVLERQQRPTSG